MDIATQSVNDCEKCRQYRKVDWQYMRDAFIREQALKNEQQSLQSQLSASQLSNYSTRTHLTRANEMNETLQRRLDEMTYQYNNLHLCYTASQAQNDHSESQYNELRQYYDELCQIYAAQEATLEVYAKDLKDHDMQLAAAQHTAGELGEVLNTMCSSDDMLSEALKSDALNSCFKLSDVLTRLKYQDAKLLSLEQEIERLKSETEDPESPPDLVETSSAGYSPKSCVASVPDAEQGVKHAEDAWTAYRLEHPFREGMED